MFQEYLVSSVKLLFFFIQVKIIQVLDFDKWHPLNDYPMSESELRNTSSVICKHHLYTKVVAENIAMSLSC